MEFMTENQLLLANGRFSGDEYGEFTFNSHQGKSTIDLIFISPAIAALTSNMIIIPLSTSHHQLVNITWQTSSAGAKQIHPPSLKFIWKEEKLDNYNTTIHDLLSHLDPASLQY